MLLKKTLRHRDTLAFRLTLWYTAVFSASILIAFLANFLIIRSTIHERRDHALLNEIKEFSLIFSTGGIEEVKKGMAWEAASEGAVNIFIRVFSSDGREIAATDMNAWQGVHKVDRSLKQLKASRAGHVFETLRLPHRDDQARIVFGDIGEGYLLQFGTSLKEDETFLEIFENVFASISLIAALIAALMGWFMARRALAGVEEVTRTALQIFKGDFEHRVVVKARGLEIEQLATTFNLMIDRIVTLFKEMKEVNNYIAHDLRSPLARMRGAAEMALTTVDSLDEHKAVAASMIEDCDHLLGLINTMLDIAEAEAGVAEMKYQEVDIAQVIRNACELFQPVAEDAGVRMIIDMHNGCTLCADPRMLQRMVGNLLDNALKYTPARGVVFITAYADEVHVTVSVRDTGIGIAENDLPYIFNKFYRCDSSRAQRGSGLGLSLVKAIVTMHNGSIVASSKPGHGSIFTVTLPRSLDLTGKS